MLSSCKLQPAPNRYLFLTIFPFSPPPTLFRTSGHPPEDCRVHDPHSREMRPLVRPRHHFPLRRSLRGGGIHLPQHHEQHQAQGPMVRDLLIRPCPPTVHPQDMGRQNREHPRRSTRTPCPRPSELRGQLGQICCWISAIC